MTEENRTYITHLKVTDVPWHRLTTAYGRGTDFPAHLTVLEQMRDLASVKESLYELTTNMEHQSTLWHATPFGMVFLCRILEKALADSGQNPAAHFLAGELLDFFSCILQCFHDGDEMEHAEALPLFSDLLKEEYLWSEEYDEEEDEMRYEEDEVSRMTYLQLLLLFLAGGAGLPGYIGAGFGGVCRACRRSAETAVKEDTQCLKNSMRCTSPRSRKWSL